MNPLAVPNACKRRHHDWGPSPVPGFPCRGCGKPFAARAVNGARASLTLGTDGAAALAAALGTQVPASGSVGFTPPVFPAPPLALSPPPPPGWCGSAGKRLARVFVSACDASIEYLGRKANDPDQQDVSDFGDALGAQLAIWFPDSAMSPAKQMILSGSLIFGEMYLSAEILPKKKPSITTTPKEGNLSPSEITDARAADSSEAFRQS